MHEYPVPIRIIQFVGGGRFTLEDRLPDGYAAVRIVLDPAGSRHEAFDRWRRAFAEAGFASTTLDRLAAAIDTEGRPPEGIIERYLDARHGLDRQEPTLLPPNHMMLNPSLGGRMVRLRNELGWLSGLDYALAQVDRLLPEALAADWLVAATMFADRRLAILVDTPGEARDWQVPYSTGAIFREALSWVQWALPAERAILVMFAVPEIIRLPGFDDCVEIEFPSPVPDVAGTGEFTDAWPSRAAGTLLERASNDSDLEACIDSMVSLAEYYYRILTPEFATPHVAALRHALRNREVSDAELRARIDQLIAAMNGEANELCPNLMTAGHRVTLAERRLEAVQREHDASHQAVLHARLQLASVLLPVNRFKEALEQAHAVLAVRASVPGADEPEALAARALIIESLHRGNGYAESLLFAAEQAASWRRVLPPTDPFLVDQYGYYLRLLVRCERADKALNECGQLVELVEAHGPEDDRMLRNLYGMHGWLLGLAGRHDESLRATRRALGHADKVKDANDADSAALRLMTVQFAEAQGAVGQTSSALHMLDELIEAMTKSGTHTEGDGALLLRAYRARNRILLDSGTFTKAASSYEQMRDNVSQALGPSHSDLLDARVEFLEHAGARLDAESREREITEIRKALKNLRPTTEARMLQRLAKISGET